MPLLNRNINHGLDAGQLQGRVKLEEPSSEMEESVVEGESRELAEGKWNQDQNLKFVIFINYYQDIFSSKHKRKVSKIFKTFQEYLQDRTAAQCRSHYQKIIQKFKTVAKVKKYYEGYYGKDFYRSEFENFKTMWEETHPPVSHKDTYIKEFREISIQTQNVEENEPRSTCLQCSRLVQPQESFNYELPVTPQLSSPPEFNPYFYWNQMGLNYYYVFPSRSEETIDLS